MKRSNSKTGRFKDNIRRNVFSYKYLRHNILMTALVVVIAVCVFAIVSYGEKADPLAEELYAADVTAEDDTEAITEETEVSEAAPGSSVVAANSEVRVAGSRSSQSTAAVTDESVSTETVTEETTTEITTSGTATILYDGVGVYREASGESELVGGVNAGVVFDLISADDTWVCIKLFDGSVGYVSAGYVTLSSSN